MESFLPTIARNSFFSAFGKLSIKLIAFIFTIFIVRYLGDEDYGRYTLIWSYVVVYSMLADAGLGLLAIREIAQKQPGSQYIAANIIIIRVLLALVSMVLILGTVWVLNYDPIFLLQAFLASQILLLYAIHDPLDAVLQAHERFDLSTLAIVIGLLVFVGTGFIFLWFGWHITGVILARLLNVLVSIWLAWRLLAKYRANLQWQIKPRLWPGFLHASLPFGLIKLLLSWSSRIDLIILAWFWPEQMVGWYGAAYALIIGIMVIPNSINAALFPALSRQYARDPANVPHTGEMVLKYLVIIAVPAAAGLSLIASQLIPLLYGADFTPAAIVLPLLIWVAPLAAISEFLRYYLLTINREKPAVWGLVLSVTANIALNFWLIPVYGLIGAAISAIAAEFCLVLLYASQLRTQLKPLKLSRILFTPLLAALIVIIVIGYLPVTGLYWQAVLGSLIYVVFILGFRVVQPAELRELISAISPTRRRAAMNQIKRPYPLVSVFIQTYNCSCFVTQAIESVLKQTYQNFELIVIDDGSTDETAQLLSQYENHPQVKIHYNARNLGISPTWNIALSLCQGELVTKLDADDFFSTEQLETVVDYFQQHPDIGLVFSGLTLLHPEGHREPEMLFRHSRILSRETFLPTLLKRCVMRAPTVFVRKECYDKLGGVVEQMKLHSDWEMWVRITANYPVGFIARRLGTYRLSYGANSTAMAIQQGYSLQDLELWLDLLDKDQLPYHLSESELSTLKWGIYDLIMRFAGIAAYEQQKELHQTYIAFAEKMLRGQTIPVNIIHLRRIYFNFHKSVHALNRRQPLRAGRYFIELLKIRPGRVPEVWGQIRLVFKLVNRTVASVFRRVITYYVL
ncbi:MAG: glycosyltransferase [Anaerolineae bacterium]|nr:glycosyltransferase [Anaerolineae bacterium]